MSWGLDDGWGFVGCDPANFTWLSTFNYNAGCCAQNVLTSLNSTVFSCVVTYTNISETSPSFMGDYSHMSAVSCAPMAQLGSHQSAAHNIYRARRGLVRGGE